MDINENDQIEAYWRRFLVGLPEDSPYHQRTYHVEKWGEDQELADDLGNLIAAKKKTASCTSLWEWEAEGAPLPEAGKITIVLDWGGNPLCIIKTVEVEIRPFNQVDEQFAYEEGEGDRSLKYWREAHWNYFSCTLALIGREPVEDMPLVCERFVVIYKE
ncbi:MAG: ASCH domain-containing protein [Chloroflexota bacterium]